MSEKIKVWALAIAIAIVLNLFFHAGLNTFFEAPEWDDFCEPRTRPIDIPNETDIEKQNELDRACNDEFTAAREPYERIAFIAQIIFATVILGVGIALRKQAVATGLMLGGVFGLFLASTMYWRNFPDIARFVILGIVLAILLWVGYKKVK